MYTPATVHVSPVDVTTAPNLRIAYLPGTGDTVPDFLPNLGVTPDAPEAGGPYPREKLKAFDAVVLGVRAYAAHPELAGAGSKPLLDYAQQGGVDNRSIQYRAVRRRGVSLPHRCARRPGT